MVDHSALLMVSVGLSSHAWRQRAHWQLQKTEAFSEVLPSFIEVRKDVMGLVDGFKTSAVGDIGSEDQLISFLQDMAQKHNVMVDTVNVVEQKTQRQQQMTIPAINAVVIGSGDFMAIQLYINEVKAAQRLLSVSSINISMPQNSSSELYDVKIVFELLLLDGTKLSEGGSR